KGAATPRTVLGVGTTRGDTWRGAIFSAPTPTISTTIACAMGEAMHLTLATSMAYLRWSPLITPIPPTSTGGQDHRFPLPRRLLRLLSPNAKSLPKYRALLLAALLFACMAAPAEAVPPHHLPLPNHGLPSASYSATRVPVSHRAP